MATPLPADAEADFAELLARAQRLVDRLRSKLQEMVNKINAFLASISTAVTDWIVDKVQQAVNKVYELFREVELVLQEFFQSPGWPPALFDAGDRWVNDVAVPSADTEGEINTTHMKVDDYWKGDAAEKYKTTLGEQQAAFAAMADLARKIKDLLHQAARGIRNFWVAIVIAMVACVGAVVSLVAGVVTAVTVVGLVLGVIGAILALLAAIGSAVWALFVEMESVKLAADGMREEVKLNTSFDGDKWPKATASGTWQAD